jgi:Flp pilus assembly pilin Flp
MHAHAAPSTRPQLQLHTSAWAIPLTLGVVFGGYAAFIADNNGASTTRTTLIAVIGCVALTAVCYAVGAARTSLAREPRSAAFGVVFGCAMGYLLSLSGYSVLKAGLVGATLGLAMTATSYYWFYQHEA